MAKQNLTRAKKRIDENFADLVDSYRNLREGISVGKFDVNEGGRFRTAAREISDSAAELQRGCNEIAKRKKLNESGFKRKERIDIVSAIEKNVEILEPAEVVAETPALADGDGRGVTNSVQPPAEDTRDDGREPELKSFLQNVSLSLIEAQQRLNEQSLDYVERLPRGIPPAYFSIPTLKAEMKVGFSKLTGKKVNLILFSKKEEKEQYGESTVTFELASAPPPPGGEVLALPAFLVLGAEKSDVLEGVRRRFKELGKPARVKITEELSLVLAYRRRLIGDPKNYLVLIADPGGEKLTAVHVEGAGNNLVFTQDIYSSKNPPPDGFVQVPGPAGDRPRVIENLGDVLMNVVLIVNDWLGEESVSRSAFVITASEERRRILDAVDALSKNGNAALKGDFSDSEQLALILQAKSRSDLETNYLVLWPEKGSPIEQWPQLAVVPIVRSADRFALNDRVFPPGTKPGFARIPSETKPAEGAKLVGELGLVLRELIALMRTWHT